MEESLHPSVEKLFMVKSTLKTHSSGSVDLIYRTCSLLKPAFQSDVSGGEAGKPKSS